MDNSTIINLKQTDYIYQKVSDECCVFIKDTEYAATLNSTATFLFLFLANKLQDNCLTVTFEEIIDGIKSRFIISNKFQINLEQDVEDILIRFKEIGLLVS